MDEKETTLRNPKSYVAWKEEAESLRQQVADLKAYGETRADEMLAATNEIASLRQQLATMWMALPDDFTESEMLDIVEQYYGEHLLKAGRHWYWTTGYGKPHRRANGLRDAIESLVAYFKELEDQDADA